MNLKGRNEKSKRAIMSLSDKHEHHHQPPD